MMAHSVVNKSDRSLRELHSGEPLTRAASSSFYDPFGNVTAESSFAVESFFLFVAKPLRSESGLRNILSGQCKATVEAGRIKI